MIISGGVKVLSEKSGSMNIFGMTVDCIGPCRG